MKLQRQKRISELIKMFDIDTQEELTERLKESGITATQATVSRDIKDMRLIKILTENSRYKYVEKVKEVDFDIDITSKAYGMLSQTVVSVDHAQNIVVVKCHAGMAQAACAIIDALKKHEIVGTIAGEDTIFIVVRDEETAKNLENFLTHMTRH